MVRIEDDSHMGLDTAQTPYAEAASGGNFPQWRKALRRGNAALEVEGHGTLPGLECANPLEREGFAFGNADTGGAWLVVARADCRIDKPERKVRMNVSHSCPLCPGRQRVQWPGQRVAIPRGCELTPKEPVPVRIAAATRAEIRNRLVIAGSHTAVYPFPGLVPHRPITLWELGHA
ncbi:hypothetical protein OSB04_un001616 [Centaurea solstitialis]|uniref:Uncharacterized protein n=1 Tax=Centaurea solstitialis TaxID=347529 RepID=A0AA38S413_9ASTR|nr:hypothetical protein OSB04_un001616 [Centaurea solstitialis]